jgi:hypothetical protein
MWRSIRVAFIDEILLDRCQVDDAVALCPSRGGGNRGAMRVSLRRPPTRLEQLLGRRRATSLRRRIGLIALGAGVSLLKPRVPLAHAALVTAVLVAAVVIALRF